MMSSTIERSISVDDVVTIARKNALLIFGVTVAIAAAVSIAAYTLPKKYEAIAIAAPALESGGGQLGALGSIASQYGGLASLAGISLPGEGTGAEAIATLQSDSLTIDYINRENLLPALFPDRWDSARQSWRGSAPTPWQGKELFRKKIRVISKDTKTNLVSVNIRWTDPVIAAKWANDLVRLTNDLMRTKSIAEAERNIAYLQEQVGISNVVELRNAIYSLMETQIKQAMVARGSESFALKVIDAAIPPEKPFTPRPAVWIPGGIIGGAFLGLILAILRESFLSGSRRATRP